MGILNTIKNAFSGTKSKPTENIPPEPRELPPTFYLDTIEANRVEKDRYFQSSPYSPIEDRVDFTGLDYYPPDPAYRYTLPLKHADEPEPLTFQTSTGDEQTYYRFGTVEFEVDGEPAQLAIYKSTHHDELFLPFRDATSGQETYGAGRYLEPQELANGELLVDFNLAYNPFCAYSTNYSCPLPPFDNHLTVAIRAGEKNYKVNNG
jgi:uncharacterized protein (DUF1684 family)